MAGGGRRCCITRRRWVGRRLAQSPVPGLSASVMFNVGSWGKAAAKPAGAAMEPAARYASGNARPPATADVFHYSPPASQRERLPVAGYQSRRPLDKRPQDLDPNSIVPICCRFAFCGRLVVDFSALTLLVGRREEHPACKNRVMRCWCGYLSESVVRIVFVSSN